MAGQCCSASELVAEMGLLLNRYPCKKSELSHDGTEVSHFVYVLCLRHPSARYKKKAGSNLLRKEEQQLKISDDIRDRDLGVPLSKRRSTVR